MRLSLLLALCLLVIPDSGLRAEKATGDNIVFDLQLPKGYCALSRQQEQEKKHYDLQDRMQRDHNGVLMLALPCDDVQLARTGKPWKEWMIWLLNGKPGAHTQVPAGMSRGDVAKELAKSLPSLSMDQINSEVNKKADEQGLSLKMRNMSVIETDEDALYSGQTVAVDVGGGKTRELAVVTGWVALNGRLLTLNSYLDYKGAETLKTLLARSKEAVMATIKASAKP